MDDRSTPKITSDSVAEKFAAKMRALELSAQEREVAARAQALGVGYIDLRAFPIAPEAIGAIPSEQAEQRRAVCFLSTGTEIRVGAVDPADPTVVELTYQLGERLHAHAARYAISEESFRAALKRYAAVPKIRSIETGVTVRADDLERFQRELVDLRALEGKLREVPVTDVVTLVIAGALRVDSSDIHLEAEADRGVIRYRIDGVLQSVASLAHDRWAPVVSRLKLVAGLKINVDDVPQDGRFTIAMPDAAIDVRVSTLPTAQGESVVMRILRSTAAGLQFDDLGIRGRAHERLTVEVARPNGMILTTGPTGSGKSTTLYAVLATLNDSETKIITLEDPVEYKLPGINQSQIDPSKDYTFAKGLRSILRQDPDIVMVGEIRDLETAEVAIQAALTGHLMLSTIHTNSAAGAIPRFLSMGVKPFLLAPALNAVIGQRLVRKVHVDCMAPDALTPEIRSRVEAVITALPEDERKAREGKPLEFRIGKGCPVCNGTGYKGRIGIYEVLTMSKAIEAEILAEQTSESKVHDVAVGEGMVTMVQDGILKALDGITTVDEVFRVAE